MLSRSGEQSFAVGSVVAGKLRIVRQLGAGGMGAVYEVEHEITRHRRALKLLHAQMADVPSVVERFLREASAAGRIGNPHIVETFDAGYLDTGEPYIVMELLQGKTLANLLEEKGPLDIPLVCNLLVQTCDAVAAAHAAGIIHRDLKPENIFLTGADGCFVKILDFGISKFDAAITGVQGLTMEGSPMGTPYYMSPEQIKGQKTVDARTDVYALGVVLYECLTAERPFDAESLPELIFLIAQGEYLPPSARRASLPKVVDEIVRKALAMDRSERFGSLKELSLALSQLQHSLDSTAFLGEWPSNSIAPPGSRRSVPAMTPDVFSRTSPERIPSANPPSKRWLPAVVAAGILAVLALGITLWRVSVQSLNKQSVTATSIPSQASAAGLAQALQSASSPLALSVTSAQVPQASSNALAAGSAALVNNRATSGAAQPAASSSARAKPLPGSAPNRSRAASQGLSEDNPFK
jgi:serine/threonine-protein kinase